MLVMDGVLLSVLLLQHTFWYEYLYLNDNLGGGTMQRERQQLQLQEQWA